MFSVSKGDFIEPFLELIIKLFLKVGAKHQHQSNQLDFWDIFIIITILLFVGGFLYQMYKKRRKQN